MEVKELIQTLTLEEKVSLCSGKDFWHLASIDRVNVPSIMLTDGPHGLRKQHEGADHIGLNQSVPATCFPTAVATGSSWDRQLMKEMGIALGEECLQEGVSVILGPGVNIKRSPLCGRNFEYISEDPFLTGEMAAALIEGIQSQGIGTSLKHYAVNNQETRRMTIDSVVDERTLREIYLTGFEIAIKKSQPWTVMGAYNKANGIYCCENEELLHNILREEWGYKGLVVSDWGATNHRVEGIKAGLDLEMPSSLGINNKKIVEAVKKHQLDEKILDASVERILKLIFEGKKNKKEAFAYDREAHHRLARKVSTESMVLLKNEDGILPIKENVKMAIIGEFAKEPRYQGAGSSLINPTKLENVFEELTNKEIDFTYARGYDIKEDSAYSDLIYEACEIAKNSDIVIIFAGLTAVYESEGFDREHMRMPEGHNQLIREVSKVNENVVVVLSGGAPVEMPWIKQVKGILNTYLSGQAGGSAVLDVIFGSVNPSGKLAETYPLKLEDNPSYQYFAKGQMTSEYRESIYVGYRYYDTAGKDVLFPFGYGLSYTQFDYSDLELSSERIKDTESVSIQFKVRNIGQVAGAEIVQIYIKDIESTLFRPEKELKGFEKVFLEPKEEKVVELVLDPRSFAYYNVLINDWHIEEGYFDILVGASSADIRLRNAIYIEASQKNIRIPNYRDNASIYYNIKREPFSVSDKAFEAIYGHKIPSEGLKKPYTINSTLSDISGTIIGKIMIKSIKKRLKQMANTEDEKDVTFRMMWLSLYDSPLRTLVLMGDGSISMEMLNGIVYFANRRYLRGIGSLISSLIKKEDKFSY